MTGVNLIVGDSDQGPHREGPTRVEVLRVKDKGFISQLNEKTPNS
jgi:hypothetical protein